MSMFDSFTMYAAADSAAMYCDRCPFDPVVRDVQGSGLQELIDVARQHQSAKHADDPITVEYVGATPYQEPGSHWEERSTTGDVVERRLVGANGEELEPWQLVAVPYRADYTFQKGGQVVHTPTALRRSCGWSWDTTEPEATGHRCAQPADSIHVHHRCGCGLTTPAAMAPGDPVVAVLNRPGYPDRAERERLAQLRRDQRALEERKRADPYQRSADAP